PALTLQLARILAGERDAVVHLHSSRAGLIGRVIAVLTGARSRTLYSPHCFAFDRTDLDPVRRRALLTLEQIGTLLGPRLVLVSATEEDLAQQSLPRPRTVVLANRVPVEALRRHRTGTDASRETGRGDVLAIVHVGRIAAQKRPAAFRSIAEAWDTARDTDSQLAPARFTWIGEGERDLLGPTVEVTGWLDRDALLNRLADADLLLFTTAGEGLPVAVLEAQAMGVPVAAHHATGMADVIRDGVTGVLRESTADLESAVHRLAADPDARRELGAAAAEHVRAHHDIDGLGADSVRAYARLGIHRPGARRHTPYPRHRKGQR
ncbi:MAG: glycosyltransferase, partial [Brachybacterium sp.]|nr:glycosyltransferase [Brachybacterium sp.]